MKIGTYISIVLVIIALLFGVGFWFGGKYNYERIESLLMPSENETSSHIDTVTIASKPDSIKVPIDKVKTRYREVVKYINIHDTIEKFTAFTDYIDTTIADVKINLEAKQPEKEYKFRILPPPLRYIIQTDTIKTKIYVPKIETNYTAVALSGATGAVLGVVGTILIINSTK